MSFVIHNKREFQNLSLKLSLWTRIWSLYKDRRFGRAAPASWPVQGTQENATQIIILKSPQIVLFLDNLVCYSSRATTVQSIPAFLPAGLLSKGNYSARRWQFLYGRYWILGQETVHCNERSVRTQWANLIRLHSECGAYRAQRSLTAFGILSAGISQSSVYYCTTNVHI